MIPPALLRLSGVPVLLLALALPGAHPAGAAPLAFPATFPLPTGDMRDLSPNRFLTPMERILEERGKDLEARLGGSAPGSDLELGGTNEMCVAVNPLDPMNIAYASLFELRVSTDGGATFLPRVAAPIQNTHLAAGDPSIAFDSQGRLFWTSIGAVGNVLSNTGYDIFIAQCNPATGAILPGYPVDVTTQIGIPGSGGDFNDKEWLAADSWPGSPFQDRLYLVWSQLKSGSTSRCTFSSDQGLTWSPAVTLGPTGTAFKWPVHVAVAPNGDVFAADHRQPSWSGSVPPTGTLGRILFYRSTDGGATFVQQTNPAGAGDADFSFNYQLWSSGKVPGSVTLLQGSTQPWILPDPLVPGRVSVVYCDDPDNDLDSGDAADVYLVRSTDSGATWQPRVRVHSDPGTAFQIMPNAAIDRTSGAIAVTWRDNRSGAVNADGHYLLDLHGAVSLDGGASFGQDFRISDVSFDPDAGASCRYSCVGSGTGVWTAGPNEAWTCGFNGLMHWDGNAWTAESNGATQITFGVWGSDASHVWTVGAGGEIRFFDGSTWSGQTSGTTQDLVDVVGRSDTDVFAVGAGGTILHWNGLAWSAQTSGTTEVLFDLHLLAGTAWLAGFNGTLLHHDGVSWSPEAVGVTTANLMAVYASSDSDVWFSGQTPTIWHGDGVTWNAMSSGTPTLFGAWGSSSTDIWFGGVTGVVHWNGSSLELDNVFGFEVDEVFGTSAGNVFISGGASSVGRYDGTSWTTFPNPLQATNPTLRIGEYNGIDASVQGVVTWVGNTFDASQEPVAQQALFDKFDYHHQVGAPALQPLASLLLLEPGRPNPFRWVTTVSYALPREEPVRLTVHDAAGRLVSELETGVREAGRHDVTWNGRDRDGRTVAAGVYFVRLDAARESRVSKLVLVR